MGMFIQHRGEQGDPRVAEFKEAAMMAKKAVEMMCQIADEMTAEFGERGSYRGDYRGDYRQEDMFRGYDERRGRDSMGRFR